MNNGLDAALGPSNPNARPIAVPNECIYMVMGKGGETLQQIQYDSGALRVELASRPSPGTNSTEIYVEGSYDAFLKVKSVF